jgi:hypothetical protein
MPHYNAGMLSNPSVSWTILSVKSTRQLMDFAAAGREPWKTKDPKALRPLKT